MDFDAAMGILARSAGDDLCNYIGEPRDRVPESEVLEAGQWLLAKMTRDVEASEMAGLSDEERIELMVRESRRRRSRPGGTLQASGR